MGHEETNKRYWIKTIYWNKNGHKTHKPMLSCLLVIAVLAVYSALKQGICKMTCHDCWDNGYHGCISVLGLENVLVIKDKTISVTSVGYILLLLPITYFYCYFSKTVMTFHDHFLQMNNLYVAKYLGPCREIISYF